MLDYERKLASTSASEFTVKGVSSPANSMVDFHVDRKYADGNSINWRERLICPHTGLNNRLRAAYHLLESELNYYEGDKYWSDVFGYLGGDQFLFVARK